MTKVFKYFGWGTIAAIAIGALLGLYTSALPAHADISNPHPTPPANSITNTMLQSSVILPSNINIPNTFDFQNVIATSSTASSTYSNDIAVASASTTINHINYQWPAAQGAAQTTLTNSGTGVLTWTNALSTQLAVSELSNASLSAGEPVYIAQNSGSATSDQYNESENTSTGFTLSLTPTCSGSAVVFGLVDSNTAVPLAGIAATFGGVSMTLVQDITYNTTQHMYVYELTGVSNSGGNFSATWTGGTTASDAVADYCGINQASPIDAQAQSTGNSTSASNSVTTTVAGDYIVGFLGSNSGSTSSGGTNYTHKTGFGHNEIGDSNAPVLTVGSVTQSDSFTSRIYGFLTLALKPATLPNYGLFAASSASTATETGFIGFTQTSVSSGSTVNVIINGIVTGFTTLTPDAQYYLNDTAGTIGTSPGSNTRKIGIALSTTTLLITNVW